METLKKYWFLFLIIPLMGYVVWLWFKDQKQVHEGAAKAREAKLVKSMERKALEELEEVETLENGRSNTETKTA